MVFYDYIFQLTNKFFKNLILKLILVILMTHTNNLEFFYATGS